MSRNIKRESQEIERDSRPESDNLVNFRLVRIKDCEIRLIAISSLIKKFKKH
jgi:hypothetical protein